MPNAAVIVISGADHAAAALSALDRLLAAQGVWLEQHAAWADLSAADSALATSAGDRVRIARSNMDEAARLYAAIRDMTPEGGAGAGQRNGNAAAGAGQRNGNAAAGAGQRNGNAAAGAGQRRRGAAPAPTARQGRQDDTGAALCDVCQMVPVKAPYRKCYPCNKYPDRVAGQCVECGADAKPEFAMCWDCHRAGG